MWTRLFLLRQRRLLWWTRAWIWVWAFVLVVFGKAHESHHNNDGYLEELGFFGDYGGSSRDPTPPVYATTKTTGERATAVAVGPHNDVDVSIDPFLALTGSMRSTAVPGVNEAGYLTILSTRVEGTSRWRHEYFSVLPGSDDTNTDAKEDTYAENNNDGTTTVVTGVTFLDDRHVAVIGHTTGDGRILCVSSSSDYTGDGAPYVLNISSTEERGIVRGFVLVVEVPLEGHHDHHLIGCDRVVAGTMLEDFPVQYPTDLVAVKTKHGDTQAPNRYHNLPTITNLVVASWVTDDPVSPGSLFDWSRRQQPQSTEDTTRKRRFSVELQGLSWDASAKQLMETWNRAYGTGTNAGVRLAGLATIDDDDNAMVWFAGTTVGGGRAFGRARDSGEAHGYLTRIRTVDGSLVGNTDNEKDDDDFDVGVDGMVRSVCGQGSDLFVLGTTTTSMESESLLSSSEPNEISPRFRRPFLQRRNLDGTVEWTRFVDDTFLVDSNVPSHDREPHRVVTVYDCAVVEDQNEPKHTERVYVSGRVDEIFSGTAEIRSQAFVVAYDHNGSVSFESPPARTAKTTIPVGLAVVPGGVVLVGNANERVVVQTVASNGQILPLREDELFPRRRFEEYGLAWVFMTLLIWVVAYLVFKGDYDNNDDDNGNSQMLNSSSSSTSTSYSSPTIRGHSKSPPRRTTRKFSHQEHSARSTTADTAASSIPQPPDTTYPALPWRDGTISSRAGDFIVASLDNFDTVL